jgi:hypothetical protein
MPASEQLVDQLETYRDLVIALADGREVDDATVLQLLEGRDGQMLRSDVERLNVRREKAKELAAVESLLLREREFLEKKRIAEETLRKRRDEHAQEIRELENAAAIARRDAANCRQDYRAVTTQAHILFERTATDECRQRYGQLTTQLVKAGDASRTGNVLPYNDRVAFETAKRELISLDSTISSLKAKGEVAEAAALSAQRAALRGTVAEFEKREADHQQLVAQLPELKRATDNARRELFIPENFKLSDPGEKSNYRLSAPFEPLK